jgi:hypothetical protein
VHLNLIRDVQNSANIGTDQVGVTVSFFTRAGVQEPVRAGDTDAIWKFELPVRDSKNSINARLLISLHQSYPA